MKKNEKRRGDGGAGWGKPYDGKVLPSCRAHLIPLFRTFIPFLSIIYFTHLINLCLFDISRRGDDDCHLCFMIFLVINGSKVNNHYSSEGLPLIKLVNTRPFHQHSEDRHHHLSPSHPAFKLRPKL